MQVDLYDNELLRLAEDLGRRMLPAFDTPTGSIVTSAQTLYNTGIFLLRVYYDETFCALFLSGFNPSVGCFRYSVWICQSSARGQR